jgi:hypothetical protein
MGLDTLIRSAVAVADAVTTSVQPSITHEPYASQNGYGTPTYGTAVARLAVVSYETKPVRTVEGHEQLSTAQITIPRNVPVDLRDRFTLPTGYSAPVLAVRGVADPLGGVYAQEVALA